MKRILLIALALISGICSAQTFKVQNLDVLGTSTLTGLASFTVRPVFNGNTPWDSGNFNPSNYLTTAAAASTYAALAGATFTGAVAFNAGVTISPPLAAAYGGSGAVTPQQYGAVGDGVHDDTSAFNAMFAANTTGDIHIPCGAYLVSFIQLPGSAGTNTKIYGDGTCSFIEQKSSSASSNLFQIGSGTLNDVGDVLVRDLFFSAQAAKTGGSGIFAKGTARIQFKNIWMSNMYNGITLDGVDFHNFDHIVIFGPTGNNGITLYDGFDCGFTPQFKVAAGAVTTSQSVIPLTDTSGLSAGMHVYTTRPNLTGSIGTIASIVVNTSVTLTANATLAIPNGDGLVFGGDCTGTGVTITGDTTITGAANAGILLGGGVGGVYIDSAHVYTSNNAFQTTNALALSMPNREMFFFPGTDFDSNTSTALYITQNSVTKLILTGAWVNASQHNCAMYVASQRAQTNPPENGAMTVITGGVIGQSGGCGLTWADTGTLSISGTDMSYNFPSAGTVGDPNGSGLAITSGQGQVSVNGAKLRSNGNYGMTLLGGTPNDVIVMGNIMTGNSTNSTQNITAGSTVVCTGNLGGSSGC